MKGASTADRHGEWDRCRRCGYLGQVARAPTHGGFLSQRGELITCWDGRECALRYRRKRRGLVTWASAKEET